MTDKHPLQHLTAILYEVEPVGDLDGGGSALVRAFCVLPGAIAADHLHAGVRL
jgi:hypothetical protein